MFFCSILYQDMEDLTKNWSRLTLSEREGPGCCLTDEESPIDFSILAKFLTKRSLNVEAIAKTFNPLWRTRNGFKIQNLGDHKILFTFENKADVGRILSEELWSSDKHLVVMQRYERACPLKDLKFEKATFWVQLHGLPFRFMTKGAAEKICYTVGVVITTTDPLSSDGGNFMRVQVTIDISLPLCRGRLISINKDTWVSFKYERLSNLCYWCG